MVKKAILACLLMGLAGTALAADPGVFKLKATKIWTVQEAQLEAFKNVESQADLSNFPTFDPDREANLNAMQAQREEWGEKHITAFSNGLYGVTRDCARQSFYYAQNGQLAAVQFNSYASFTNNTCPESPFPRKSTKYLFPTSELISVTIHVSDDETYTFYPDGRLMSHWKDDRCTLADGTDCGTRD